MKMVDFYSIYRVDRAIEMKTEREREVSFQKLKCCSENIFG